MGDVLQTNFSNPFLEKLRGFRFKVTKNSIGYWTSRRKRRHLNSPRSVIVSSASRSQWLGFTSGHPIDSRPFCSMTIGHTIPETQIWPWKFKVKRQCQRYNSQHSVQLTHFLSVSHQGILSTPFRSMTIGPPIPEIQFDLENPGSKVKVNGTTFSAASSWLISLTFHIRASYRLLSLSFHDIGPPITEIQFDLKISRSKSMSKVKIKGTLVSQASSWLISLLFHIYWTNHS